MQDVAERAGVSRATVSLVLSGRPGTRVSPPTVRRVLQAAAELGYEPRNESSRGWVALVIEGSSGAALDLLGGALEEGWRNGRAAVVVPVGVEGESLAGVADALGRGSRHPVAYLGLDEPARETLSALPTLPRVVSYVRGAQSRAPKPPYRRVLADDEHAASRTAEVLAQGGHRRVALVADPAEFDTARTWKRGLERSDAGFLEVPIVLASEAEHARNGLGELLGTPLGERPTALVCTSRRSATYAFATAELLGLAIPEDVTVVVRDDGGAEPLDRQHTPLRVPAREMGRVAVRLLLERASSDPVAGRGSLDVQVPFSSKWMLSKPCPPT